MTDDDVGEDLNLNDNIMQQTFHCWDQNQHYIIWCWLTYSSSPSLPSSKFNICSRRSWSKHNTRLHPAHQPEPYRITWLTSIIIRKDCKRKTFTTILTLTLPNRSSTKRFNQVWYSYQIEELVSWCTSASWHLLGQSWMLGMAEVFCTRICRHSLMMRVETMNPQRSKSCSLKCLAILSRVFQ